jgi:hypothetical protein
LKPLFTDWKRCQLIGVGAVPASLLQANMHQQVNIAQIAAKWTELNAAMVRYAESRAQAIAAYDRFSLQEKQRMSPPPWMSR